MVLGVSRRGLNRLGWAAGGLAGIALAIYVLVVHQAAWWPFAVFLIAPDITFLVGLQPGLQRGQLARRAVPVYNAAHRFWAPAVLVILSFVLGGWAGTAAGLAWCAHIAIDRSFGFGLRTPEGFQSAG